MSGIGAIFHRDGRPVEREQLERMSRSLALYGPERRAVMALGEVGFVYTHFTNTPEARLGTQPLTSGSGRYTLVFDGRIDNREELAETLGLDRARLAGMSDAALVLANWEKSGVAGLNHCVGEFAMIVWDREARALALVRDQFGRRPLHYNLTDARIVVASLPKGIHALGDIPRELDRTKLADALIQVNVDHTRSFFRGVDSVDSAHVMTVARDRVSASRYYALRDHVKPVRLARDEDYAEAAHEHFSRALTACLRSPGKIGMQLSSGMDSSLVAAHAAPALEQAGQRLSAYTWVPREGFDTPPPPGHCYDESPAVQAMAALYPNIDVTLIGREQLSIYDGTREFFLAAESVMRNGLNMALIMATGRAARSDAVKVLLNGSCGNFTLSYNGDGLPYALFSQGRWAQLVREVQSHPDPRHQWKRLALSVLPEWLVSAARKAKGSPEGLERRIMQQGAATRDAMRERQVVERARAANYKFNLGFGREQSDQHITFLERYVGPMEANFLAAMPALFGFEQRDPFFDRRLVEWRYGVPEEQFRHQGETRVLMRRLLAGKVPPVIADQQLGKGQQSADWRERLAPDLDRIAQDLADAARMPALAGVLDEAKLARLIEGFPDGSVQLNSQDWLDYQIALPLGAVVSAFANQEAGTNRHER